MTRMLMRCTRRATLSTKAMAAMDPAKAARIRVSELVSRPWFKNTNGVGKKGLQQVARYRERRPQQHHHNGARQAQLQ